jgi:Ca2+-binding RTX toxin-like protein
MPPSLRRGDANLLCVAGITTAVTLLVRLATAVVTLAGAAPASANAAPAPTATAYSCQGRAATIVGTADTDVLTGTSHDDVIVGLGGDDRIEGLEGDDLICGDKGSDQLLGGLGNDRVYGGEDRVERLTSPGGAPYSVVTGDVASGGAGNDYLDLGFDEHQLTATGSTDMVELDGRRGSEIHLAADGSMGTSVGHGRDLVVGQPELGVLGSRGADRIWGSPSGDYLEGASGADEIHGMGGDDYILGFSDSTFHTRVRLQLERGRELLAGGPGNDQVQSNLDRVTQLGGPGADHLLARGEHVRLSGGRGRDSISVGPLTRDSCPVVSGGGQRDVLQLSAASEPPARIEVDLAGGLVNLCGSAEGVEYLSLAEQDVGANEVRWVVHGTDGDDYVRISLSGRLEAHLRGGDDTLIGGPAYDLLDGGPGDDKASGKQGDDSCPHVEHVTSCER